MTTDLNRLPPEVRAHIAFQAPPSGTRVHALLNRLEGVRAAGDGKWSARCPAHEDRSPSLSVRDTGERVLLHCFTGCESEDVLAALGLTWSDLYEDRLDAARFAQRPNKALRRRMADLDPLEVERAVLRIAATEIRSGRVLGVEDQARVEVARERLKAWEGAR
ncbi:hypothetical protein [Thiocapsa marina]|uniref:Zinc finger CHC2-type domain-containing protein n=1 Tax=Thiocapsa marina 5811 TaxID=768671 RepID=F9UAM1_9GAMM|nr:hypothetical protein [Thiocapsa marina]EGV18773.1 hypothetical protein ThimaDRAFT_2191 [Thiocapsa marina 5811]